MNGRMRGLVVAIVPRVAKNDSTKKFTDVQVSQLGRDGLQKISTFTAFDGVGAEGLVVGKEADLEYYDKLDTWTDGKGKMRASIKYYLTGNGAAKK